MKKSFLAISILSALSANAQSGKVGVNTSIPTETLSVNGTTRVSQLPANGAANAIYTTADGTASTAQDQSFTATRTVVADANGVLGIVPGLPITQAPNIKSIQYKTLTVPIDNNCPTASVIDFGDVSIRFNAISNSNQGQFLEFKLNNFSDACTATTRVAGSGGVNFGDWDKVTAVQGNWYKLSSAQVTIGNEDLQTGWLNLLINRKLYRITVSMTNGGSLPQPYPRQVTLFIESLTD